MSGHRAFAIALDAIADTRPLWRAWLDKSAQLLALRPHELPEDRAAAAAILDRRGIGNWPTLLERFCEEHAPVHLQRDPAVSAALRELTGKGHPLGVFSDAPEPLARVALAQLGAARRVDAVETGDGALERLVERLGRDTVVLRTREELVHPPAARSSS